MIIEIRKVREDAKTPVRASDGAVGYDVFASRELDKKTKEVIADLPVKILSGESVLIGIGVQMAVPFPFQCEMRPRSGLASRHDIELSNSPGTIDPDFRGAPGPSPAVRPEWPWSPEPYPDHQHKGWPASSPGPPDRGIYLQRLSAPGSLQGWRPTDRGSCLPSARTRPRADPSC